MKLHVTIERSEVYGKHPISGRERREGHFLPCMSTPIEKAWCILSRAPLLKDSVIHDAGLQIIICAVAWTGRLEHANYYLA